MKAREAAREAADAIKWFQKQGTEHREEIASLRKLIILFADELAAGGMSERLLARELRDRLKTIPKT